MDSTLLQLLLAWVVGIPAAVLMLALAYPWYLRERVARARRRVERQRQLTWLDAERPYPRPEHMQRHSRPPQAAGDRQR